MSDIWASISSRMATSQQARLAVAAADYGSVEITARAMTAVPSLSSYVSMRLRQSRAICLLAEYAAGVEFGERERDDLRGVHEACAQHLVPTTFSASAGSISPAIT